LPLKDNQGLQGFIDDIYNPASPNYKRYLTVEEFTERFGPTAADYSKVIDFLKSSALLVTFRSRARINRALMKGQMTADCYRDRNRHP
jgi:kumamolisin